MLGAILIDFYLQMAVYCQFPEKKSKKSNGSLTHSYIIILFWSWLELNSEKALAFYSKVVLI